MPLNADQDVPAIQGLGNNISTAIMLNTRAKLAQSRLAQQYASDYEQAELRKMQQMKLQQEVADLVAMQDRVKRVGTQVAADYGDPNLQSVGEIIAGSPAAMVNYAQGYSLGPGDERRVPFRANPVVSTQPRELGINQRLVPNKEGESGYMGSASAGVYVPPQGTNAPVQIVPPAPRYSTPQGEVEQIREENRAMSINAIELERLEELDPEQFKYTLEMRRRARARNTQGGRSNVVPTMGVPQGGQTNAPVIRKYNPATGRIE